MKLMFCGGAKFVTGANYLLESDGTKLLVDCGLFQGSRFCDEENFEAFAYDPSSVDALLVTHAHIDHIGRIPLLAREGFGGRIVSTAPTKDLARPLLEDAQHMMHEESLRGRRRPLYDVKDIDAAMGMWETTRYHERLSIGPFTVEFFNAGHVLGSASILVEAEGKRIVFSGDLGNMPSRFIEGTEHFTDVDYALVESAYGDRNHEHGEARAEQLEDAIEDAARKGGVVMIPAFALERTQEMIWELNGLVAEGRVPDVPFFVDSPLAIALTDIYRKYGTDRMYFTDEIAERCASGAEVFSFPGLTFTPSVSESKEINDVRPPKVVIAGSGMSQGGRIVYHEQRYLPDPKNVILFIGYQTAGSPGRRIQDGEAQVEVGGEPVSVRCAIRTIGGYSAHADQRQLLGWLESMKDNVRKVFVVQGEPEASETLATLARDSFAIDAEAPDAGTTVEL